MQEWDLPVLFDLLSDQRQKWNTAGNTQELSENLQTEKKFQHAVVDLPNNTEPELPLGFQMPANVVEMQKTDPSQLSLFQKAKEKEPGAELDRDEYILQNRRFYCQ